MSAARPTKPTWLDACRTFASVHGIPAAALRALDSFRTPQPRGGPPPPRERGWTGDFASLEASITPVEPERLARQLTAELDGSQPGTFARRVVATEAILRRQASPAARILRVGLLERLAGIRAAPPPRARRVRALADYYYSLAVRGWPAQASGAHHELERLVGTLRWRAVADGLEHAVLDGRAEGLAVHVNLLRVDPGRVAVRVDDLGAEGRVGRGFAEAVGARAAAAVSGGFFLYSEDDIAPPSRRHDPVGLLLVDGEVRGPPVFARAGLLVGPAGEIALRTVSLADTPMRIAGRDVRLDAWWNRAHAEEGPPAPSIAVVERRVVAVGRGLTVPLNGFVATLAGERAHGAAVGDAVAFAAPRLGDGAVRAVAGLSGGPMLVRDGRAVLDMRREEFWGTAPPITFSQDETGDQNLLARMAVGSDARGRLLFAAVDGRNVERALGMTLGEVARLLIHCGCTRAMNLDGGSSKRMLVRGRVVDLPSTEIVAHAAAPNRVRPVHTAVLFEPRDAAP